MLLLLMEIVYIRAVEAQSSYPSQYSYLSNYIGKDHIRTLDSARLKITYSLNYLPDSMNTQNIIKDRKTLLIGDSIKHFFSAYVRQADSVLTKDHDKGKSSAPIKRAPDILGEGYNIYTDYPNVGKRRVLEYITELSAYEYEEDREFPEWIFEDETCTILEYSCQKASAHYRGRDWTVWFSTSVPLNVGPWKLGGLPGLIMKAYDSRKHYLFECIGIEQLKKKEPIIRKIRFHDYSKCTREEYRKTQAQYYNDFINFELSLGFNVNIVDDNGNVVEHLETPNKRYEEIHVMWGTKVNIADRYRKIPYNPIELE
ncbi:MAG: GLPGLI family protein [Dysgonamonadaceae bacterium]|nr:GLPGLI family protein [Dysgonamonadaceae bacterium]